MVWGGVPNPREAFAWGRGKKKNNGGESLSFLRFFLVVLGCFFFFFLFGFFCLVFPFLRWSFFLSFFVTTRAGAAVGAWFWTIHRQNLRSRISKRFCRSLPQPPESKLCGPYRPLDHHACSDTMFSFTSFNKDFFPIPPLINNIFNKYYSK